MSFYITCYAYYISFHLVYYIVYIRACYSHGRTLFGLLAMRGISIIWSVMHSFPVCCIDLFIASLSIGPLQHSRPTCPSLKGSCETQASFHCTIWRQIFNSGCYSNRDSLLAQSTPCWICSHSE